MTKLSPPQLEVLSNTTTKQVLDDDLSIDEARTAGGVCRTCRAKLASAPFAGDGKQRCTNHRCTECCQQGCQHARSL